jgi:hypothetical protein
MQENTMYSLLKRVGVLALLGCGLQVSAEPIHSQTGWLELVKGHLDDKSGATVADVQPGDQQGTRKVTLYIPRQTLSGHEGDIEEVRVTAQRPDSGVDIKLPEFRYEWVDDYDNDYYGLVIHLRDDGSLPLRLYLESGTGYADQELP